jgi:hypothetical protein
MPTDHLLLDQTDRKLASLARISFERDLRDRIDSTLNHQLEIFLAGELSRWDLAEAA